MTDGFVVGIEDASRDCRARCHRNVGALKRLSFGERKRQALTTRIALTVSRRAVFTTTALSNKAVRTFRKIAKGEPAAIERLCVTGLPRQRCGNIARAIAALCHHLGIRFCCAGRERRAARPSDTNEFYL